MSYSSIYRIDPNRRDFVIYYSSDYTNLGLFGASAQFNTLDAGPIPPLYTPPPSEKLIPGIICDSTQNLGLGQPHALRLYDSSSDTFNDLTVNQLRQDIIMQIDSTESIYISCISSSAYQGQHILTMIFNIYDASGWVLRAENDVSLNITKEIRNNIFLTNQTRYDLSLAGITEILGVRHQNTLNSLPQDILDNFIGNTSNSDMSYSIYIQNNNEIYIKSLNSLVSYNSWYVDSFKFKLYDLSNSNFVLSPSDVFLYISPATLYEISYNTSSQYFSITTISNEHAWDNSINYLNRIDQSGTLIGKLYPYGYKVQSDLEYYNINNLTYNENNLIRLSNTPIKFANISIS